MIDLAHARAVFDEYLSPFCLEDEKIKLKVVHTDGVIQCAKEICRRMQLSQEDSALAELIALLHDIGRFEQIRLFDSFEPSVMDHAAYGVQLLFGEQRMIRRFLREETWDNIIREAIGRHSDYAVGEGMNSRELLHARIIRDADKLDNCRVKLEDRIEVLLGCSAEEAGSQEISAQTWAECEKRRSIHSSNRRTRMDYWVSYIAYFFDINYSASSEIILENDYVDRIIRRIPYSNRETEEKMWILRDLVMESLRRKKILREITPNRCSLFFIS